MELEIYKHYSLDITHIDNEHFELLSLCSRIDIAIKIGDIANAILLFEKESALFLEHHESEKTLMTVTGFPYIETHLQEHLLLIKKIKTLKDSVLRANGIKSYTSTLVELYRYHIDNYDRQYGEWYHTWKKNRIIE